MLCEPYCRSDVDEGKVETSRPGPEKVEGNGFFRSRTKEKNTKVPTWTLKTIFQELRRPDDTETRELERLNVLRETKARRKERPASRGPKETLGVSILLLCRTSDNSDSLVNLFMRTLYEIFVSPQLTSAEVRLPGRRASCRHKR